jgi:hypothetical protein
MLNEFLAVCTHAMIAQTKLFVNSGNLPIFLMNIYSHIKGFAGKINYVFTFDPGFGSG